MTSAAIGKGAACKEGGSEFTSASGKTTACNGAAGKEGKEGSPWTAGGVLPKGSTETGVLAATGTPSKLFIPLAGVNIEVLAASLSFTIPLENAPPRR